MFEFTSKEKLREHCIDHVLTPTESHGWCEVFEGKYEYLAQGDDNRNRCYQLRQQWSEKGQANSPCPDLVEAYVHAGLNSYQQSERTGWRGRFNDLIASVDTSGVFALVAKRDSGDKNTAIVAITIYLPGHFRRPVTRGTGEYDPHGRGIPQCEQKRQAHSAMRRQGQTDNHAETRRREKRLSKWSQDQKIYNCLFRKSIAHLKKAQPSNDKHSAVIRALKTKLPPISQLTLQAWTDFHLKEEVNQ